MHYAHTRYYTHTALGLKTQFPDLYPSTQKASERLQHNEPFSLLAPVMEPGATHTYPATQSGLVLVMLSRTQHVTGVIKAAHEWMMDCSGNLCHRLHRPGMDGWIDGWRDGGMQQELYRANSASHVWTVCDRRSSMCTVCVEKHVVTCALALEEMSQKIQASCYWTGNCIKDRVQVPQCVPPPLAVLRCDAAGWASCLITSYLPLSHSQLWNWHLSNACWYPAGMKLLFFFLSPTSCTAK